MADDVGPGAPMGVMPGYAPGYGLDRFTLAQLQALYEADRLRRRQNVYGAGREGYNVGPPNVSVGRPGAFFGR